jgi:nucleolar GTP-binding protein
VGKSYAGKAGKAVTVREATQVMEEGFKSVEQAFQRSATSLDSVKDIARVLRKLPTVDPTTPTVSILIISSPKSWDLT